MTRRRLCGCPFVGCPCNGFNLELTVLPASDPLPRTQLFTLRIHGLAVFHTFPPQLDGVDSVLQVHWDIAIVSFIHTASPRPGELH